MNSASLGDGGGVAEIERHGPRASRRDRAAGERQHLRARLRREMPRGRRADQAGGARHQHRLARRHGHQCPAPFSACIFSSCCWLS